MKSFHFVALILLSYAAVQWGFSRESVKSPACHAEGAQVAPAGCSPDGKLVRSTGAQGLWSWANPPKRDNEWEPNEEGKDVYFRCIPLMLDEEVWADTALMIGYKGILTLAECQDYKPSDTKIPFRIYLRRQGEILETALSSTTQEHTQIEVHELLKQAKDGDQLIINPVRKRDFRAKRILTVRDGC